jgi:hypothetical protein
VKRRKALLSFGLMDPIETMVGNIDYVNIADTVRISSKSTDTYFAKTGETIARLKSLIAVPKRNISTIFLSVHSQKFSDYVYDMDMVDRIIKFQFLSLAKAFPGKSTWFGFRINRSSESPHDVEDVLIELGFYYLYQLKQIYQELETHLIVKNDGQMTSLLASGKYKGATVAGIGVRFINSSYTEKEKQKGDEIQRGDAYGLALFPEGVHAFHTTMNINDRTLRFTFDEFNDLMSEAERTNESLGKVMFRHVDERRSRKVIQLLAA